MTQKPKILHFFTYISSTSTPFQKHFTSLYRATLVLHFMFWLLRCTLWLERIMSPNLKFPSLLKHYHNLHNFLNYYPNKTCDTLLPKGWHELHLVLLHISHIKGHSGSGSRFVSKFSFLPNFVNSVHRGMYNTSKKSYVQELDFIFLHLRALSNLWGRYDPTLKKLTFLVVIVSFLLIE